MAITINGDGLIDIGGTTSTQGRVRLAEDADNGSNYVELTAPASVASNRVITFPDATTEVVGTDTTQTLTNKTLTAPLINGGTVSSATLTSPTLTSPTIGGTPVVNGSLIVSGTAVTATGTAVDFTGIPSWVKRVTVMFNGVSLNGSSSLLIQVGAGSIISSGYSSSSCAAVSGQASGGLSSTAGFTLYMGAPTNIISGQMVIINSTSTIWNAGHFVGYTNASASASGGGLSPSLSGALDRIRITTVNGTDTFDAGTINIIYE